MKYFCLFFVLNYFKVYGQDIPVTTQLQMEQLADARFDLEDDQLLQRLDYLLRHPIHINNATKEQLLSLPLLNEWQVQHLIGYRKLAGRFIDVHELQAVPGWDAELIQKILPYITLADEVGLKENFLSRWKGDHALLFRVARSLEGSGNNDPSYTRYLGDRQHLLLRYRFQYKDLLYTGITGEKDAGEQFFKGAQPNGFDFYSFHFFMKRIGVIKMLALGDFTVNLGQGLLSWQSTGFGKSAEVLSVKRSAPVLSPYRAAGESNFYRGAGLTIGHKKYDLTVFASFKKISATVEDSSGVFTGINTSGYHRTDAEVRHKNQVSQFTAGGKLGFTNDRMGFGINAMLHQFSLPLEKRETPYNLYAFSGQQLLQFSADFNYTFRNMHVFGEVATDNKLYPAVVAGALLSADPAVDLSLVYRWFSPQYTSLFGNAFSEGSLPVNEFGMYAGISVRPFTGWQFQAYADVFSFPWLRFRVNAPSRGYDFLVQTRYRPNREVEMYLQYRNRYKPLNTEADAIAYLDPETKQNLRFHVSNSIHPRLTISARVEVQWYKAATASREEGFLAYIEAHFQALLRLKTGLRFQYFETNSYNSRIYAYEPDVLYGFFHSRLFWQGATQSGQSSIHLF